MKVLLDSNILIRWLEPDNPDQIIVKAAMDRLVLSDADFYRRILASSGIR
jgi:hypothetical protein